MASLVKILLFAIFAVSATSVARAEVSQYGAGFKTCASFLEAKDRQSAEEVEVLDWLSGYVTGANSAFNRINNVLGTANLAGAAYWLGNFCRTHPTTIVAVASNILVVKSRLSIARVSVHEAAYGVGFKSCAIYWDARTQQNSDESSFVSWLAGFVSGVNAVSLGTDDVLGDPDLTNSIFWLDSYCQANPGTSFQAAVDARLASSDPRTSAIRAK